MTGANFGMNGWMLCQGQTLQISEYETLFNLIGTTYGGDGQETFCLPDLQSRVPIHMGTGGGASYVIGEPGGVETVTLSEQQMPTHAHQVLAVSSPGNASSPEGAVFAASGENQFVAPANPVVPAPGRLASVPGYAGGSQPHDNMQPYLVINFPDQSFRSISFSDLTTTRQSYGATILGQIMLCSFNFPPKNWAFCNGQFLPINQNQPLFSLLGTTYGGNGQTTFALPDLRGRVPIHFGSGYTQGNFFGETAHTLSLNEMPQHAHTLTASSNVGIATAPAGNLPAASITDPYSTAGPNVALNAALANDGGGQAHLNLQPYLVLNFCIALAGIFPSSN